MVAQGNSNSRAHGGELKLAGTYSSPEESNAPSGETASRSEMGRKWRRASQLYPELLMFETDEQRRMASRQVQWSLCCHPRTLLWGGALLLATLTLSGIIGWSTVGVVPSWALSIACVAAGVILGLGFLVISWFAMRDTARLYYRRELQKLGLPVCVNCGYDLRGGPHGVCPECGSQISAQPREVRAIQGTAYGEGADS